MSSYKKKQKILGNRRVALKSPDTHVGLSSEPCPQIFMQPNFEYYST